MAFEIAKRNLIRKERLDPNQYTVSLMKEGFRVGLIDRQAVYDIRRQVMLILKDLILRYTGGESTSVKIETAESLLNSIYYSIDAGIGGFDDPEEGLAVLKAGSVKAVYEKGVGRVAEWIEEAKGLYAVMLKNKVQVPMAVYNATIEALPGFFKEYGVVFGAHDTPVDIDYPLAFDDMSVRGVLYIKNYIATLEIENRFCSFFDKADILSTLDSYDRICHGDYKEAPVNLFEIVINNSIFSVLSGNHAGTLTITELQGEVLKEKLRMLNTIEINTAIAEAVEALIGDLGIEPPDLVGYIRRYKPIFIRWVLNAVENNSLYTIVITDVKDSSAADKHFLAEGSRMGDEDFRLLVRRILECERAEDKAEIIKASVHSPVDFIDILNGDCLFGEDYAAVFSILNHTELAILGEKGMDGTAGEWQIEFIKYIKGL